MGGLKNLNDCERFLIPYLNTLLHIFSIFYVEKKKQVILQCTNFRPFINKDRDVLKSVCKYVNMVSSIFRI